MNELFNGIGALALLIAGISGMVNVWLNYQASKRMAENTRLTAATHEAVNGQSARLEAAARDSGVRAGRAQATEAEMAKRDEP